MIKNVPIIGVQDVVKSSEWYQQLFNCKSGHGGDAFEMLHDKEDHLFLCLHKWGEHEHPTLSSSEITPGNGLVLYLTVQDLQSTWENAQQLNAQIEEPIALNPNSGKEQFSLRDLDGYYLMITR